MATAKRTEIVTITLEMSEKEAHIVRGALIHSKIVSAEWAITALTAALNIPVAAPAPRPWDGPDV